MRASDREPSVCVMWNLFTSEDTEDTEESNHRGTETRRRAVNIDAHHRRRVGLHSRPSARPKTAGHESTPTPTDSCPTGFGRAPALRAARRRETAPCLRVSVSLWLNSSLLRVAVVQPSPHLAG